MTDKAKSSSNTLVSIKFFLPMKNKVTQIAIFTIFLILILGCSAIRKVSEITDKNSEPKVVESKDKTVQLTVPKSWSTKLKLNPVATLEVSQPLQEVYAVIIPDPKVNLIKTADLDWFTDQVRKNLQIKMKDVRFSETTKLKINGFEARRFEASGTVEKIKIGYVFSIVETPENFFQVMTWTLESSFKERKPILKKVSDSFKLIK